MATSGSDLLKSVKSTLSIVLDTQPSCLEFAKSNNILIVGTYNLEAGEDTGQQINDDEADTNVGKPAQKRTGSLLVFHITEQTATLHQSKVLPYALLDLHFSPIDSSIFAIATSVGSICFFSCNLEHGGDLSFLRSIQICDKSILVLSFAYKVPDSGDDSLPIAVSLSNGHLAVFTEEQGEQNIVTTPVHDQEAWTVSWSKATGETGTGQLLLYSGADDSTLCKHSLSFPILGSKNEVRIEGLHSTSCDVKTHTAGVTAIVALPVQYDGQEIILTGSYDEYVRILIPPLRSRGRAKLLAERRLGGGVWRISSPFAYEARNNGEYTSFKMLASCMHAGAKVLEIHRKADAWSIEVVAMFTEHDSMNYASDFRECSEGLIFVSTSFYDRRLCIWNIGDVSD